MHSQPPEDEYGFPAPVHPRSAGPAENASIAGESGWFDSLPSRRAFLLQMGGASACLALSPCIFTPSLVQATEVNGADGSGGETLEVTLGVNGQSHTLRIDPRATLLDTLRERLNLTGSKKGCDHGQCGSCTVLANGRRVNACLTLAAQVEGDEIVTIEGLAKGEELHPVQAAFIKHDGFQCGYCTPGQICSAVALLKEGHAKDDWEIREWMSGNICRCGAYPNIVAAIREVRSQQHSA